MSFNVNSVTGSPPNEQNVSVEQQQKVLDQELLEKQKIAQQASVREAREEAIQQQQEEQQRMQENLQNLGKYVMSESDMRELLVLMGSKGNAQAVERMVESMKHAQEESEA